MLKIAHALSYRGKSSKKNTEIVRLLLDKCADVNIQTNDGDTALIIASFTEQLDIVKILLDKKAVNVQDKYGSTALMAASISGHMKIEWLLVDNNANVNIQDNDGSTALSLATQEGHAVSFACKKMFVSFKHSIYYHLGSILLFLKPDFSKNSELCS